MKKKSRIIIFLIAILVIAFAIVYIYFNHDFENAFTKEENEWIKANINQVIDIEVPNDYPVFGDSGIFKQFSDSFEKDTGLSFNFVTYLKEGKSTTAGLRFRLLEPSETLKKYDILLQEDPYALFGKDTGKYDSIDKVGSKTVGFLTSDSNDILYYLKRYSSLKYKTFDTSEAMFAEYEAGTIDAVILPINMFVNKTLANDKYNILYVFPEMSKKIVFTIGEDASLLNSIAKKYFKRWKENNYVNLYNKELLNYYINAYKINDKDKTEFLTKKYVYGYVENYPYEVKDNNDLSGIAAEYLNRMKRLAGEEFITYKSYESIDALKKDVNAKKVDIYFNYFDYEDENFNSTISTFNEKYVVIGKIENKYVVNSFESLKGIKTSILTNNSIYNYFKDNSKASLVPFDDLDSMLAKTGKNVIVLDKEVYSYYKNSIFKDYDLLYEDSITNQYNFMILKDPSNEVFYKVFNYLINTNSYYKYRNNGLNSLNMTVLEKSSFGELYLIILAIILIPIIVIGVFYLTIKRKKKVSLVKKEERRKYTDMLTSLKNRNYLNYSIKIWNNNKKYPQAVIVVDLNNVKYVNDNYGYEQGDKLILDAASILVNTQLENSELIRSDGNEFVIYLVGYSENQVATYTKKLTKEFKNLTYGFGAALGYSMILDEIKSVDDAINEATLEMRKDKDDYK